ncbi:ABC transporter ATP-binding protein/permease [Clostridium sp. MSJ-8]|uniref:ABC transporter ATP-binding protein n=1 Tax=Clostridium sp. MSJ-8 TaxID=2841510 RepID=UPI001C0EE19F|nr:ABC transporter ATP-binding protein [Clostridium sp. MSJ-8]MBU5487965.1 ABC transporter ATP-binding protein/permease [Clostridium sp. MSJ-8]
MKEKKSIVQWLAEFASRYKYLYIVSVISAVIGVLSGIIPYVIMGKIVSELIKGNNNMSFYVSQVIWMAIFWIMRVIGHAISTTCSHKATFHVLGNMRKRVCDKLSKLPLGYVKETPSGTLKNIIVERIDSIETTLAHILPEFTSNLLAPICVFIYLLVLDWRMALVSLISLPLGLIAYMGMMIGYEDSYKNTVVKTKTLNDTAVEYINGIEVIKAFGKARNSYEKFKVAAREGADCYIEWMRRCNVFFSLAMVLTPCTAISVLPIGGIFVKNGSLDVSTFIMCVILSFGLIAPLITVMSYTDDLSKLKTIMGEITGVLVQKELDRPEKDIEKARDYSITMKDVRFSYKEDEVLHGINLSIPEGTVNAFVGPSGSGKSTIAKLIASLWDADSGTIEIGGVDIKKLSLEEYNRKIAYVAQDNYLFDDTIRENIRMGRLDATDTEVEEVARRSGCDEFIRNLENGYDTVVGGAGGHLSGGERQRISIARAMLKDAPIVILDEATAYTDPENEAVIQSSVAKLVQGKTLIVIAHRLSTIVDADNIFVIKDGNVFEQGTHNELLEMGGLYKDMWETHISARDTVKDGELNA